MYAHACTHTHTHTIYDMINSSNKIIEEKNKTKTNKQTKNPLISSLKEIVLSTSSNQCGHDRRGRRSGS